MNRVIISEETDLFHNLALEDELLSQAEYGATILYLWVNSPCVIIGRNQNPWLECNLDYLEKEGIKIARRSSGGGAVYQDLGNLNYTFINKTGEKNIKKQNKLLLETLEEIGISAKFSGRNDLLIEDKKISGQAEYSEGDNEYLHGTLMVNVDIKKLELSLIPSENKLISKGIKSIRSRVTNIKEYKKNIDIDFIKKIMINKFQKIFGDFKIIELFSEKNMKINKKVKEKYESKNWIINSSPQYEIEMETIYKNSNLRIKFQVEEQKIKEVIFSSDSLEEIDFSILNKVLIGEEFDKQKIKKLIQEIGKVK